ncbi:hypothetical protein TNCV_1960521 [Trichonephila clavipes]|nr:hypothetical protein TNCV_1960521 [Trichonephila clavipes]
MLHNVQCRFMHWEDKLFPIGQDKLDLTRFSSYKFRSSSAKRARRTFAPTARNELKSALILSAEKGHRDIDRVYICVGAQRLNKSLDVPVTGIL